jgi:hypothetical protein
MDTSNGPTSGIVKTQIGNSDVRPMVKTLNRVPRELVFYLPSLGLFINLVLSLQGACVRIPLL